MTLEKVAGGLCVIFAVYLAYHTLTAGMVPFIVLCLFIFMAGAYLLED